MLIVGIVLVLQWNPSSVDTLGMSCIERCPHFRGTRTFIIFGTLQSVLNTEVSIKRGSTVVLVLMLSWSSIAMQ